MEILTIMIIVVSAIATWLFLCLLTERSNLKNAIKQIEIKNNKINELINLSNSKQDAISSLQDIIRLSQSTINNKNKELRSLRLEIDNDENKIELNSLRRQIKSLNELIGVDKENVQHIKYKLSNYDAHILNCKRKIKLFKSAGMEALYEKEKKTKTYDRLINDAINEVYMNYFQTRATHNPSEIPSVNEGFLL